MLGYPHDLGYLLLGEGIIAVRPLVELEDETIPDLIADGQAVLSIEGVGPGQK